MYIHRDLEKKIKPFLNRKEVLSIIGARQVGKTTFLKYLYPQLKKDKSVKFITFEDREELSLFNHNIKDFRDLYSKYDTIIIDEFQYAEEGGQKLKYLFDTTNVKYLISGSSSLDLVFKTGQYMVGRMMTFTLWPFSFREYLSCKDKDLFNLLSNKIPNILESGNLESGTFFGEEINLKLRKLFEEYLVFGGYPEIVLAKKTEERKRILKSVLTNYLLKDISNLLKLATEDEIIFLAKALSARIGNLIEYKELSNIARLNYKNLIKHLEILKKTHIIDFIKPYFTNRRTELTKNPKVYFIDLGFRNSIISDFRNVEEREDLGSLVENYVFMCLKRVEDVGEIKFWRTKSKAEVDFIFQKDKTLIPIEVRYRNNPGIGKSFYSFINKYSPSKGLILTKDLSATKKVNNTIVYFIPVYYF